MYQYNLLGSIIKYTNGGCFNNNKLLSQNIYQSVHSNMNRGADK